MIKYDDVATQTTEEYFNNNQFSIDVFNKKYRVDNETYVQTIKRVCDAIASVEKTKELQKYWGERWFDEIYNDWWHPAGSIMQGAGSNKNISLANCTTISLGVNSNENWDNLESIIKNTAYTVAKTAAYRQGLGVDFSALRPRETSVYNSSNESTGAVHWMRFIDQIAMFVGQKGRIPAFLFSINCSHPDVIEFIKAKSDYRSIQNANISVQCTDALYEAAEKDENWTLSFTIPEIKAGEKVYIDVHSIDLDSQKDDGGYYYVAKKSRPKETITKTVKAREILELIAKGMCNYAEPGIQNIDIARKYSNSDYVYDPSAEYDSRILSSNACVTGDTEIITKNGYMPIVNLINQEVEIWNGFEWSKVIPKITNHNQKILKFTFSDGRELKTTYYHEFILPVDYTNKTKRVKAIDLKVGDKITKTEFPLLNEGVFFKDAYTQGFISGDGMDEYKILWIYDTKYNCINRLNGNTTENEFVSSTGCKRRCCYLKYNPLPKEYVPFNWDIKSKIEWLSGLFDADGSVLKEGGIQLASINRAFLINLQKMLSLLGVNSKVVDAVESGYRELPDGNGGYKQYYCQKLWRILIGSWQVQNLKQLGLNCSRLNLDFSPNRDASQFAKIISIEDGGIEPQVYCFNEEKRHTGCFNGIVTGQCSEQYLSRESLCVLASINCENFSPDNYEEELKTIGESINRFLDNVNEYELVTKSYATPHQRLAIENLRRTGAGLTNICAWLFKQNLEYGSVEGNKAIEYFVERYNYHLYRSSINLGKEKGSFKLFNREKLEQSPFIQRMMTLGLEFENLRNITCSSLAPTGSLTLMFRTGAISYGVEPAFGMYYWKRTRISGKYAYYFCVPSIVRKVFEEKGCPIPIKADTILDSWDGKLGKPVAKFIDENATKLGIKFKRATEINALDKLDLMSRIMKSIDSSISVTYMLPENTNWKDVYNFIIQAHKKEVKSIAAFPDKQMYGIVSYISFFDLATKLLKDGVNIHESNFTDEEKHLLSNTATIIHTNTIERPKELPCDVNHISVKGKHYLVLVGLMNGQPYEVFSAKNGFLDKEIKHGRIIKNKRGYKAIFEDETELSPIMATASDEEETVTRLVSALLREKVDLAEIVKQLDKVHGDLTIFAKSISRTLKKYIKVGTKTGSKCPECGGDLVYQSSCQSCSCGWSKCS